MSTSVPLTVEAVGASSGEPTRDTKISASESSTPQRKGYTFIEALRGISALVIVTHHLSRYGPQSDHAMALFPELIDAIWFYGSYPVQIFLVISGFVGAISLRRAKLDLGGFGRFLLKRYLRLGLPYLATIVYGLFLYSIIPAEISSFPLFDEISWKGMASHAFFLQDIFGFPSLYAGFWYLAVDYQCSALFFLLMAFHAGILRVFKIRNASIDLAILMALFLPIALLSIFHFNLDPEYSIYAPYFFGTIFLGILCGWSMTGRIPGWMFFTYLGILIIGLIFEWRPRLVLAMVTAVAIYFSGHYGKNLQFGSISRWLSRISYSLFLTHYPTSWAISSIGAAVSGDSPWAAVGWMLISVVVSLAVAEVMYKLVEEPTLELAARIQDKSAAAKVAAAA